MLQWVLAVFSKQTKMAERMVATLFAVMQEADNITEEDDDNVESFFATVIAMKVHLQFIGFKRVVSILRINE